MKIKVKIRTSKLYNKLNEIEKNI